MSKKKWWATGYISADREYAPGDPIDLDARDAEALLSAGVISAHPPADESGAEEPGPKEVDIDEVIDAIDHLDPDDPDRWTKTGKPQVVPLEDYLGYDISAAQRDAAWEQYQAKARD